MREQHGVGAARRKWLFQAVASLGLSGFPVAVRYALAMGERPAAPGLYRVEGDVRVGGRQAAAGQLVRPGDAIETGARSQAVFIVGRDAYLLRAGSRLETTGREMLIDTLRLVTGRLLSVLGPGARRIETPTATIGIRGTDYELMLHDSDNSGSDELYGYINDGVINAANKAGKKDFADNEFFKIVGPDMPPQPLLNPPGFRP